MENAIFERVKNQVSNLKVLSEELQVQMALGKAEAKDLINRERKNLSDYIQKQRREISELENTSEENRREFLTAVENVESALYTEVPESTRKYDKYKKELLRNIYILEEVTRINYPYMNSNMQIVLDGFKVKMDAFRVNLALHDKDDPEKVFQIRRDFTEKIAQIRVLLADKEKEESKLDNFMEDISESFNFLKKAITDLSKD